MSQVKLSSTVRQVLKSPGFWAAVAPAAIGTAITAAGAGVGSLRESRGKARAYQDMVKENPALKGFDGKRTQAYFNSMYRASPDMAKDPYVAGAWVHNVLDNQDPHDNRPNYALLSAVSNLAGPSRQLQSARLERSRFSPESTISASLASGVSRAGDALVSEYKNLQDTSLRDNSFRAGEQHGKAQARSELSQAQNLKRLEDASNRAGRVAREAKAEGLQEGLQLAGRLQRQQRAGQVVVDTRGHNPNTYRHRG